MNEYYGAPTTPTSDYLAHYGVKGMKWGVRKAIETGNQRLYSKHYQKAQKKLQRLTEQAKTGKGIAAKRVATGGIASALTSAAGTYALNRLHGASRAQSGIAAGIAAGVGGAAGAAINAGRATSQEKRIAKIKRDNWKREMDSTFRKKSLKTASAGKKFEQGLKKTANRYGMVGGGIGSAIGTARYIKKNPKQYQAYKKKFKQMSFKDRMRAVY